MSNRTYNELWMKTQKQLSAALNEEHTLSHSKPERDREIAFKGVSKLYLQYVMIFRHLDTCYDQIVHPQKRFLLRQLLDAAIGRILELKNELVNLDNLEYSYHDESIAENMYNPSEVELIIPKFVLRERAQEIERWRDKMNEVISKLSDAEPKVIKESEMTFEEALSLLQRHERGRQGRLRAKLMLEIRKQEASVAEKARAKAEESISVAMAASKIQSIWKGALARRRVRKQREEELAFIGMIPPTEFPHAFQDKLSQIEEDRRLIQFRHQHEYEEALKSLKEELREKEGVDIEEDMKEEIRDWFMSNRDDQGKFPDYPSDDEGGSGAIFHPEKHGFFAPNTATSPSPDKRRDEVGDVLASGKEDAKSQEKTSEKKNKDIDDDDTGFVLRSSDFVRQLKRGQKTFNETWRTKDESNNKIQNFDKEMVLQAKRAEVEEEIRLRVDSLMRDELDILKVAAERDKGKKGKIAKKRKKGKKKASKKGKKKKDKDLTPDRTTESLFEELVLNGIIKPVPRVDLTDFKGEMNFIGSSMKKAEGRDPNPGGSDIRRAIAEYCILPMSSSFLRENVPHHKSILLVGPEGCGKTMLLQAICTELGATFFDLTATNIVGKYPGKSGLNMLLHLVIKVSKLLQPSVIFIDQAEKAFLKKVSKTDKSDPKRLKKDLPRLVRSLTSEDRVILIGASRSPWECEQKGLTQTYQKVLMLPRPDYGFRYYLWKELITAKGGKISRWSDKFDISSLARVSDGYTAGHIARAVKLTLTERRTMQQGVKPLNPSEFLGSLAKNEPVYKEEEEMYEMWYSKTAMGKKRSKYVEGDEEESKKEKKKAVKRKK